MRLEADEARVAANQKRVKDVSLDPLSVDIQDESILNQALDAATVR